MSADAPVLIGFDGSDDAGHAIEQAGRLLGSGPAVVIHCWKPFMVGAFRYGPEIALTETVREAATEMDEAGAAHAVAIARAGAEVARHAGFDPVEARAVPTTESMWSAVNATAREVGAAMVVVGAKGRSGAGGALLGSVSNALVHHADRPVLVVPVTTARD